MTGAHRASEGWGSGVGLGRDQGLGGAQGISTGQEGLGGASKVLNRAGRAQQDSGTGLGRAQESTWRGHRGVWWPSAELGGSEVARGASVVGRAEGGSELGLKGFVKGARLPVGGGSWLISTRGTHLLTVRHWHPLEYPQGRVAHRHPLLLPAGHNADGPDRAWDTMATNPAIPPRSGWPRGASVQHRAELPLPPAL